MEREVSAGVHFLKRMAMERGKLDADEAEVFAGKLQRQLCDKYSGHWYKNCPSKGQAYRCIQIINGLVCDDVLLKACRESHLTPAQLGLPRELTLWIDPLEVCARSGENCRPFTVARFQEEEEEEEEQGPAVGRGEEELKGEGQDARGLDTSDYHSASSSDCGSTASSDTEEEAKEPAEAQEARQTEGEEKGDQEEAVQEEPYVIVMVPRSRDRLKQQSRDAPKKTKFARNLMPAATLQYFYQPAPAWPRFEKSAPVFLTPVCAPLPPPPPVFGYYFLPQPPPPFIVPQAPLQPIGAR
ncbi:protein BTG3 [Gadus macrocephalus]|uniref:protein BTG3 n=1 Tax=Gadus macrocephalus TaxID=80720 RepID=UPI0028CBB860|nr:protein BTG3 [Gadus macrocephalus]